MADRYDPKEISSLADSVRKMFSLDEPKEMSTAETVADIAAGFVPGVGTAQAARDFERARRSDDKLGMAFAGVGAIPILGGVVKPAKAAAKSLAAMAERYAVKEAPKEQKMLMGVYRGYAGERGAPEDVFATPQKSIADYYARRRAAETGGDPHAEMLLVDPFAGEQYGLSIPLDKYNRDINFTKARKLKPEDVKDRTQLYAQGGLVNFDPDEIDRIAQSTLQGYAEGGKANIAPYGIRHSGEGVKGLGYFGLLPSKEGVSTEISAEDDEGEYPLLVPTLTREEIDHLLSGNDPTEAIYEKAVKHAKMRKKAGKSPFAAPTELRRPLPKDGLKMAAGGLVDYDPDEVDTIVSTLNEEFYG
jgi:hypothetical protein